MSSTSTYYAVDAEEELSRKDGVPNISKMCRFAEKYQLAVVYKKSSNFLSLDCDRKLEPFTECLEEVASKDEPQLSVGVLVIPKTSLIS